VGQARYIAAPPRGGSRQGGAGRSPPPGAVAERPTPSALFFGAAFLACRTLDT